MLTNIEMKLEEYLNLAEGMTPDYVDGAEKAREKDRRKVRRGSFCSRLRVVDVCGTYR